MCLSLLWFGRVPHARVGVGVWVWVCEDVRARLAISSGGRVSRGELVNMCLPNPVSRTAVGGSILR